MIKNLLYIYQQEYYIVFRFLRYAYTHLRWWNLEKQEKLKWTLKAKLIYILSLILTIAFLVFGFIFIGFTALLIILILLPVIIIVSALLLKPIELIIKKRIIAKAKRILEVKKPVVIGITGSYGKTSTKEILSAILAEQFTVLKTPENVNTDLGIANFILNNLENEEVFIVEMGAFYSGDIAKICNLVQPDYSILTGINEAHLDRFKSLENIIKEKFSLLERTKTFSILNFDDGNIVKNIEHQKSNVSGVSKKEAENIVLKDNFGGLEFEFEGEKFQTSLLAEHNITLILLAVKIAKKLGMNMGKIRQGVSKIKPLSHRMEPIYNKAADVWVIDDSYNANPSGIKSGIKVLSRAKGRKIVLTPGIVELGKKSKEIHREIGRLYAESIDLVLLIKSGSSDFIQASLQEAGFKNYKIYSTTAQAHNDLKNVLKSGDTIIFQNDWPDIYF